MKAFYLDGSGLFQDDNVPIYRARWDTEWLVEYENGVNYILWPPELSPIEHLWEILG